MNNLHDDVRHRFRLCRGPAAGDWGGARIPGRRIPASHEIRCLLLAIPLSEPALPRTAHSRTPLSASAGVLWPRRRRRPTHRPTTSPRRAPPARAVENAIDVSVQLSALPAATRPSRTYPMHALLPFDTLPRVGPAQCSKKHTGSTRCRISLCICPGRE